MAAENRFHRRKFVKQCLMGGCALALSAYTLNDFFSQDKTSGLRVGFRNDGPDELWKWSREAMWYEQKGRFTQCRLCPHGCILGENDRGFCRTRVVKDKKLHTIAYGNPCAVHLDPIEKKPLYHFLPGKSILSIATAGCNLRCLNCQNWQISQSRPEDLNNHDLPPELLVSRVSANTIPAIAYTYSEPLIYYEYVFDSATLARQKNIRNVLVTAGYIQEKPLRQLCGVTDAANIDLKGFTDNFYKKVTGSKLAPVMRSLQIAKEENVWVEVTRLVVPTFSDDLVDIRAMCDWLAETLGPGTPLHISRFHPQYKLEHLPPTPVETMLKAYETAKNAGLHFVYVGNLPGNPNQDTVCPSCGRHLIERSGYTIISNGLKNGRCSCGEIIPGVWL
ncbi:MAG: AmmeMemoRadiSam system radical SAM enzyme [Deltaproteobacteria bacterium]|jgi:pyruvate formate lyase activating enzyme|nr:AmmeMemoRadiSam system radical SAM enzyme [Deltaproteobacteria bacterium]